MQQSMGATHHRAEDGTRGSPSGHSMVRVPASSVILYVLSVASLLCLLTPRPASTQHPWPMFQHDAKHTGRSPFAGPTYPEVKWQLLLNNTEGPSSPAVAANGTVYVGSIDERWRGLHAVSPSGTRRWVNRCGAVGTCPAIDSSGIVYASTPLCLHAINPDSSDRWCRTMNPFFSSPTLWQNTIFIGCTDSCLYAINCDSTLKWLYRTGGSINNSPAVDDSGVVYVGSEDCYLYAVNPNGTVRWRYRTNGAIIMSSPAIAADGTVYVGTMDSSLYAVNPNGSFKWRFKTKGEIWSSPAIGQRGTIYVASLDSFLYALNADGSLKWSHKVCDDEILSSPAIDASETVYIGTMGDHFLFAIDSSGHEKWRLPIPSDLWSSAAIGGSGVIYVNTEYPSYLVAVGQSGMTDEMTENYLASSLLRAASNPFVKHTTITAGIEAKGVSLIIYDATGRVIDRVDPELVGGGIQYRWLCNSDLPSGLYFARLGHSGSFRESSKGSFLSLLRIRHQ